jgi:hypothetical protein
MQDSSAFQFIAIDTIHESTTNPRRTFDEAKLCELADLPRAHDSASRLCWRFVEVYESEEHCSLALESGVVRLQLSAVFRKTRLFHREGSLQDANVIEVPRCSWRIHAVSEERCSTVSAPLLRGSDAMSPNRHATRIPVRCFPGRARWHRTRPLAGSGPRSSAPVRSSGTDRGRNVFELTGLPVERREHRLLGLGAPLVAIPHTVD